MTGRPRKQCSKSLSALLYRVFLETGHNLPTTAELHYILIYRRRTLPILYCWAKEGTKDYGARLSLFGLLSLDKRSGPSFSACCSTTSTVVNNQVGDESSYSRDNDIDETASARNNRNADVLEMVSVNTNHSETTINVHDEDTTNRHPSTAPLLNTTPINSPEVNKKGFLGFLYTLTWILFTSYSALLTFSVTYPTSAKALVSFDEARTRHICLINLTSWLGSIVMLPFASRFKGDRSTNDHDGFGFFIWALYPLLLALIPEYFLTLHVYLHIPESTAWFFGPAIFSSALFLILMVYIEGQRPTIASICAKYWKKLKCCHHHPARLAPSGRQV